MLEFITKKDIL